MKASSSLFSCNRVKTQASGHEAGEACWPAGVEKLPWKLPIKEKLRKKINDFILKIALDSEVHHAKKSKLEF